MESMVYALWFMGENNLHSVGKNDSFNITYNSGLTANKFKK